MLAIESNLWIESRPCRLATPRRSTPSRTDETVVELRSQLVARRLRDAIVGGRYSPGERLRQEQIASEMGISRVPVREALRQLETEGLVTLAPHAGATVAQLDPNDLDEIYAIRIAVEPMLIAESAPRLDQAQLEHLRSWSWRSRPRSTLRSGGSTSTVASTSRASPARRCRRRASWSRGSGTAPSTTAGRTCFGMTRADLEVVQLEHRLILDALERGNGEDAGAALRTHLRRTREALHRRAGLFRAGEPRAGD